ARRRSASRSSPVASRKRWNAATVTTKPGGTGNPARVISPRLAPLPPTSATSSRPNSSTHRMYFTTASVAPRDRDAGHVPGGRCEMDQSDETAESLWRDRTDETEEADGTARAARLPPVAPATSRPRLPTSRTVSSTAAGITIPTSRSSVEPISQFGSRGVTTYTVRKANEYPPRKSHEARDVARA